jgi:hypothetical protein
MSGCSICTCGHSWYDHYDGAYCLIDNCCCGPCEQCGFQFIQLPTNEGVCEDCLKNASVLPQVQQVPNKQA